VSAYRSEAHVKLAYELELEDLAGAMRRAGRAATLRALVPPVALVTALVAGLLGWQLGWLTGVLAGVGIGAFGAWLVWWALRVGLRTVRTRWDERKHQRFEATEDAFEIHNRTSGKRIAWDVLLHWTSTEQEILLYVDPQTFHVIPKRVFPSREVQTALERLLDDRIPEGGEAAIAANARGAYAPFVFIVSLLLVVLGTAVEAIARLVL